MLSQIVRVLVVVGGINWGLVGLGKLFNANWNVVNLVFGSFPTIEAIIYILIGLAAVKMLWPSQ